MKYVILVVLALFIFGCGRKNVDSVEIEDASLQETTLDGMGVVHANPPETEDGEPSVPHFSCCESNISAKERGNRPAGGFRAVIANVTQGNKTVIKVKIRLPIIFDCANVAGQSCIGTFEQIDVMRDVRIANAALGAAGAAQDPGRRRVWWTEAVANCDGRDRKSTISIFYVAEYAIKGQVANEVGTPAPNTQVLTLELKTPAGKGTDRRLSLIVDNDRVRGASFEE